MPELSSKRKYILIVVWFVIPATFALSIVKLIYNFHHLGIFDIPYSIRYHLWQINYNFPVLYYTAGVVSSSSLLSILFVKIEKSRARYIMGSVLGALVYILAVSFHAFYIFIIKVMLGEFDVATIPISILIATTTSFCFTDCTYGYALPSLPFGIVWGGVLTYLLNKYYTNEVLVTDT